VIKPLTENILRRALQDALQKEVTICFRAQQIIVSSLKMAGTLANSHGLSQRESQIVACLLLGTSNKEVAGHLGLSPNTVHVHLGRIFRKLNVHSRAEAVQYFMKGIQSKIEAAFS
jgi:DNA-binding NarL/FixJ family response regulator